MAKLDFVRAPKKSGHTHRKPEPLLPRYPIIITSLNLHSIPPIQLRVTQPTKILLPFIFQIHRGSFADLSLRANFRPRSLYHGCIGELCRLLRSSRSVLTQPAIFNFQPTYTYYTRIHADRSVLRACVCLCVYPIIFRHLFVQACFSEAKAEEEDILGWDGSRMRIDEARARRADGGDDKVKIYLRVCMEVRTSVRSFL